MKAVIQRTLPALVVIAALVVVFVVVGLAGSGSSVTKARLERSMVESFTQRYLAQAKLLGKKGITARSLAAKADCDRGGPKVPDVGPGADWLCQLTWNDPAVPLPDGSTKFELNVHSNDCYTAGGPSKFVGLQTITDLHGHDATNPLFEWDACFDPGSSNTPTNVVLVSAPTPPPTAAPPAPSGPPPTPSVLKVDSTSLTPDKQHALNLQIECAVGKTACTGTLVPSLGQTKLTRITFAVPSTTSATVPIYLTASQAHHGGSLGLAFHMVTGASPGGSPTVTVKGR
jgi:hypothetical protein